eukprot:TRINITY_DN22017_c0_g1_i1.p1 TRINITY_DN22017_c0_g1~~TRINITY_DN22017_c0_g1_i1.p1  ORF type:complete len:534 (-),score=78.22 TRINITY_DN22017_c0_g1_i1:155-1756(-)
MRGNFDIPEMAGPAGPNREPWQSFDNAAAAEEKRKKNKKKKKVSSKQNGRPSRSSFASEREQYDTIISWIEALMFQTLVPQSDQMRLLGFYDADLLRVASNVEVVVILCSHRRQKAAIEMLKMACKQRRRQYLIALVIEDFEDTRMPDSIGEFQVGLLCAGADHVVLQKGEQAEVLHLDLLMAVQDIDLDKQMLLDRCNSLFWSQADQFVSPQLPAMNDSAIYEDGNEMYISSEVGLCRVDRCLGRGGFAEVRSLVNLKTRQTFAMKVYEKILHIDRQDLDVVTREFSWIGKIPHHPNVVKLIESMHVRDWFILIMTDGGPSLFRYQQRLVGNLDLLDSREFSQQILTGIAHCHAHRVAHRDLKPENIGVQLAGDARVRGKCGHVLTLLDFGSAADAEHQSTERVGTPAFMAPEILGGQKYRASGADTWSIGVIVFEFLFGLHSLTRLLQADGVVSAAAAPIETAAQRLRNVLTDHDAFRRTAESTFERLVGDEAWEVLQALLELRPKLRPSAADVLKLRWLRDPADTTSLTM